MIRLDSIIRKLQIAADSTLSAGIGVTVTFFDMNKDGDQTKASVQLTSYTGPTDGDICAAPKENFVRNIDGVSFSNSGSATHTFTVKIDESAADYVIQVKSLTTGQSLHYEDKQGWYVL